MIVFQDCIGTLTNLRRSSDADVSRNAVLAPV